MELKLLRVVDLVKMKGVVWQNEDLGAKFDYVDIPEDLKEKAKEYRQILETAIEEDEKLMEAYLEKELSEQDLINVLERNIKLQFCADFNWFCI